VAWAFGGAHTGNWHPITWLSHMLDCELFGLNPNEEHWVNLGFHAANVALVFLWLWQLTGARWRSFFVAALFAAHPLHVQSVAWISERKDVLSGFFFMGTLMSYTAYCRNKNAKNYALVAILLALGLMAKPMLVSTPLVLLLVDFWPLKRWGTDASAWKALVVEKVPLFVLCAVSCVVTVWAQSSGGAMEVMQQFPLAARCFHAVISYALYLEKMFWPVNLAILYPLSLKTPGALEISGAVLLLAAIFLAAVWRRGAQPYLLMGWAWFFVMLLPVIGVVQVGMQAMADRYAYLPSIGLFIAVVWGAAEMAERAVVWRPVMAVLGAAVVLACGIDARYQLGFWRNNITLFRHVVEVTPKNNWLGYFYLGISYAENRELDSAADCLREALKAYPEFDLARSRLGNVLLAEKKYAEAEPWLDTEAKIHPSDALAHATLGMALAGKKKFTAAQSEFEAAQQLAPGNVAVSQLALANAPKAEAEFTVAMLSSQLSTNSTTEGHAQLAAAHSVLGHFPEAVQEYRKALGQSPERSEFLNNLAWLLATCPDASIRDGTNAVALAGRACELTQFKKTVFVGTLAAAYAEAGQFEAAVITAKKACDNATANGETDLLQSNQRLLSLYQNHQAYHGAADAP